MTVRRPDVVRSCDSKWDCTKLTSADLRANKSSYSGGLREKMNKGRTVVRSLRSWWQWSWHQEKERAKQSDRIFNGQSELICSILMGYKGINKIDINL